MQARPSKAQYTPVEITDTGGVGEQAMRRAQALMAAPWNSMGKALAPTPPPEEAQKPASEVMGGWQPTTQNGQPVSASLNERDLLAKTIAAEAGGEAYEGQLAVAAVIANRARSGRWGKSLQEVIMAPGQFTAWNGVTGYAGGKGALNMDRISPNQDNYRVADAIISGQYKDVTGGALNYYNDAVATPKWGMQAGGNWQRIGNHVFGTA